MQYTCKNKRFHNFRHKNIFVRDYRNNLSQKLLRIHACLSHMQIIWNSEVFYHVICGRWMLFQYEKAKAFKPVPYFTFQDHVGLISLSYGPSMGLVCSINEFFLMSQVSCNIIYSILKPSVTSRLLQKYLLQNIFNCPLWTA